MLTLQTAAASAKPWQYARKALVPKELVVVAELPISDTVSFRRLPTAACQQQTGIESRTQVQCMPQGLDLADHLDCSASHCKTARGLTLLATLILGNG
jgi:hypothetical protein